MSTEHAGLFVRVAALADAGELAAIHVEGRRWAYRGLLPDALLDGDDVRLEREWAWRRFMAQPPARSAALIAERGGAGAGLVSVGPSRDPDASEQTGEVYSIYLRSSALAGAGIGSALMRAGLAALRGARFRDATLWVLTTNARARAFYERGGWRADGAEKLEALAGVPLPHARYRLGSL